MKTKKTFIFLTALFLQGLFVSNAVAMIKLKDGKEYAILPTPPRGGGANLSCGLGAGSAVICNNYGPGVTWQPWPQGCNGTTYWTNWNGVFVCFK